MAWDRLGQTGTDWDGRGAQIVSQARPEDMGAGMCENPPEGGGRGLGCLAALTPRRRGSGNPW